MITVNVNDDGTVEGYMTVNDASKKWNVTERAVRIWIHRGKLYPVKIGGNTYISENTEKPKPKKRGRTRCEDGGNQ